MTLNVVDYTAYFTAMAVCAIGWSLAMYRQGSISLGEVVSLILVAGIPLVNHVVAIFFIIEWGGNLIEALNQFSLFDKELWRRKKDVS